MGPAAVVLSALAALAAGTDLDVGLRAEGRAGAVRSTAEGGVGVAVDAQLSPALVVTHERGDLLASGRYTTNLALRGSTAELTPFGVHRLAGDLAAGREARGLRLELRASLTAGEVTFDEAAEELDQPFGLGRVGGVVPLLNVAGSAGVTTRPFRHLALRGAVQAQVVAGPRDDAAPVSSLLGFALPSLLKDGALAPQLIPEVGAEVLWEPTRRDALAFELRVPAVVDDQGFAAAAAIPAARYQRALQRDLIGRLRAGAAAGYQRSGPRGVPAGFGLPLVEAALEAGPAGLGRRGLSLMTSAGALPLYDRLLGAWSLRFALRGAVSYQPLRWLQLSGQLAADSRLMDFGPSERPRTDEHVVAARGLAAFAAMENLRVETGLSGSLRASELSPKAALLPEWSLFVAVVTGFGWEV